MPDVACQTEMTIQTPELVLARQLKPLTKLQLGQEVRFLLETPMCKTPLHPIIHYLSPKTVYKDLYHGRPHPQAPEAQPASPGQSAAARKRGPSARA